MELFFVSLIIFIFLVTRGKSSVIKGMYGEFKVSQLLKKHLQPPTYQVLNDVTIPSVNGTTQVDHVVVSPYGIFVLETKNYSGWVFGSARDAQWTQTARGRKSRFQNPIRQNYAHVKALEAVTGQDEAVFHSIVVFVGDAIFKTMIPDGVCFTADLIDRIKLKGKRLLSESEVIAATQAIRAGRLEPGFKTDKAHVEALGERFAEGAGAAFSRGVAGGLKSAGVGIGIKLVALVIFAIIIVQALDHIQASIRNLGSSTTQNQPVTGQAAPRTPKATPVYQTRPATQAPKQNQQSPLAVLQQQQQAREALQHQQWESSLRCGYSIDTNRCACYDRKGVKATVEFERCKELATGKR